MAIFIQGKTVCALCGKPISSTGVAVAFPKIALPPEFVGLADGFAHRTCLATHPSRRTLIDRWSEYWKAQALATDGQAHTHPQAVLFQVTRRFVFVSFEDFMVIEEVREDLSRLAMFFASAPPGQKSNISLGWSRYQVDRTQEAVGLLITSLPRPKPVRDSSMVVKERSELVNHQFAPSGWERFSQVWKSESTANPPRSASK